MNTHAVLQWASLLQCNCSSRYTIFVSELLVLVGSCSFQHSLASTPEIINLPIKALDDKNNLDQQVSINVHISLSPSLSFSFSFFFSLLSLSFFSSLLSIPLWTYLTLFPHPPPHLLFSSLTYFTLSFCSNQHTSTHAHTNRHVYTVVYEICIPSHEFQGLL